MKTVYKNFVLLDGTENMKPEMGKTIVVEDGLIVAVADYYVPSVDETVIDLGGRYLMPGLINLHVHLPAGGKPSTASTNAKTLVKLVNSFRIVKRICIALCVRNARQELLSGVTSLRAVGGVSDCDTMLRDMINSGRRKGPRILAANYAIAPVDGHGVGSISVEVKNEDECRREIEKLASQDVDFIKIMITGGVLDATVMGEPGILRMPPELVKFCCDEAHKRGYKVAAHTESSEGVRVAAENGVDTIEHGASLDEHTVESMKKHSAAYICTISPAVPLAKFDRAITLATEIVQVNSEVVLNGVIEGAKTSLNNGIPVGLGTDTGCPFITHYNMWRELSYFSKCVGVSPEFALHTATLRNAQIAGIDDITGSITAGKYADILVTDRNPLEDFSTMKKPYCVIMAGKRYMQPKIRKKKKAEKLLDETM